MITRNMVPCFYRRNHSLQQGQRAISAEASAVSIDEDSGRLVVGKVREARAGFHKPAPSAGCQSPRQPFHICLPLCFFFFYMTFFPAGNPFAFFYSCSFCMIGLPGSLLSWRLGGLGGSAGSLLSSCFIARGATRMAPATDLEFSH